MIVYKEWYEHKKFVFEGKRIKCRGWFLFGLIPLYIIKEQE